MLFNIDKVILEQRFGGSERVNHVDIEGRAFQAKRASLKEYSQA